ncbi:MAG TPA: hemolysin family protein [Longimicrobiales bacterium]|nr:hemolysin family protein [Longimicrobiales bacterium]
MQGAEAAAEALTVGQVAWRVGFALLLVAANGFFVAAEFSLVGSRRTRIEALAREGNRLAGFARRALKRLDHYLSATQLGITLASIGLGFVAESTIAAVLIQLFVGLDDPWNVVASHAVAGTIAFAVITVLHIVLGELAPKSLAITAPETVAMWTAAPLMAFAWVLAPFIYVLNGLANRLLQAIGQEPVSELHHVHEAAEIEVLAIQSAAAGRLGEEPVDMIRGVFDLSETTAEEVMTPRTEVVAVARADGVQGAARLIVEEGHSRLPVYEESLDRVVGVVVARDVWRAERAGVTDLDDIIRPATFVPDSKSVEELLREMQRERVHLSIVVDEFGGTAGVVTIEDLVEEIVGEIQDEFDHERPDFVFGSDGRLYLEASLSLADINDRLELDLPEDEYTTLGGYLMGRMGRIAREGDVIESPAGRFTVLAMLGRRILRVQLDPPPAPEASEASEA